jgi:hypothetical protein
MQYAAKRFIGLAIGVRRKDRGSLIPHRSHSSHIARMNMVRRSHEHPLGIRHHAVILLGYFRLCSAYPHFNPQRRRQKRKKIPQVFLDFFLFNESGPLRTALPPIGGGGMASKTLVCLQLALRFLALSQTGSRKWCDIYHSEQKEASRFTPYCHKNSPTTRLSRIAAQIAAGYALLCGYVISGTGTSAYGCLKNSD